MADPSVLLTFADEQFTLAHISVQEMMKVKGWTPYKNRREWFTAIGNEDPEALLAAYVLTKQRKGEDVRFSEVDFDLDTLGAKFVDDDGREVEPVVEKLKDGTVKTDKDGAPIPVLDKSGRPKWTYADTGEPVPTEAA